MGFRFRRVLTLLPGVHLNISKGGISLSVGGAPITFNFGRSQSRVTTSLPGTGLSYEERLDAPDKPSRPPLLSRLWSAIKG